MSIWERRGHLAIQGFFVAALLFGMHSCGQQLGEGGTVIVNYDNARQACEEAGGIWLDRLCFSTENLVPLADQQ